jgi:nucleotide-binding universal stress UspA family protein
MRIDNVLVPVDFSPPSNLAIDHGVALARRFRARLTILHVVESSKALTYTFPAVAEKVEGERFETAEKMLPHLVNPEDREDLDLRIVVKSGDAKNEILAAAELEHADIIVMGTHGRSVFGRAIIGSVAQGILRQASVPIVTVSHASRPAFNRILFATDLSNSSDDAFRFVLDLAGALGATLAITHVVDKRPAVSHELPEVTALFDEERRMAVTKAHSAFHAFEAKGAGANVTVVTVLAQGDAGDAILRVADENAVDFIVIGVRDKGRFERALMGATAERLIREAHVPVLSFPLCKHVKQIETVDEECFVTRYAE